MSWAPYEIKALLASAIFASFFLKLSNIALLNLQLVLPHHIKTICCPNVHVGTASHVHTLIEYEDLQNKASNKRRILTLILTVLCTQRRKVAWQPWVDVSKDRWCVPEIFGFITKPGLTFTLKASVCVCAQWDLCSLDYALLLCKHSYLKVVHVVCREFAPWQISPLIRMEEKSSTLTCRLSTLC